VKRKRSIPQALLRLRAHRIRNRMNRAARRSREVVVGVMPGAARIDAANDPEK
jgi:hypothetical protein